MVMFDDLSPKKIKAAQPENTPWLNEVLFSNDKQPEDEFGISGWPVARGLKKI